MLGQSITTTLLAIFHITNASFYICSRRICPGMLVAEREIWLTIARMLWAFDMTEIPGEPIDLKEYDGLSGRSPVAFRVKMTPRDENVAAVLEL